MQALAALSQRASLTGSELKRRERDIMDNSIKSRALSRQFITGSHCKYDALADKKHVKNYYKIILLSFITRVCDGCVCVYMYKQIPKSIPIKNK